ncbi:hypothetical protein LV85_00599 [Algoriphagus chordae]|uniref:Uncharacterized protein n=1 Tax=Algoriphagus chordae TaxID=237019 RepID=A0A2W7R721_9BACT|nr:hypothetical protein LV85_00599 [Algoriphagus chordae]
MEHEIQVELVFVGKKCLVRIFSQANPTGWGFGWTCLLQTSCPAGAMVARSFIWN